MGEAFLPPERALDLTRAILARTSGSPCQRLQDLACAYVDGELEEGQGSLVRAHLETCPGCADLIAALAISLQVLPGLVHLDPGPWFTQAVLRATTRRRPRPSTWWRLMHRPRIALEAAYLGAAAGLLGMSLPLPSTGLATRVPALVQPLSDSVQRVAGQVVQAEQRTTSSLQKALQSVRPAKALQASDGLWRRLSARMRTWSQGLRRAPAPHPLKKEPPPANSA